MFVRRWSIAALMAGMALSACTPRQPVYTPPPAPAQPAPPAPTPEELAEQAVAYAAAAWREGIALGRQGRWADAEARYREAVTVRPNDATYHLALASALLVQNREWEGADALWAGIRAAEAEERPNHRVIAVDYERLVQLLNRLNRLDEARQAAERQRFHRMMRDSGTP